MPGEKKKKVKYFYDYSLVFAVLFLTVFGMVMIFSASSYAAQVRLHKAPYYYMLRQGIVAGIGIIAMFMVSLCDYHKILNHRRPILAFAYLLNIVVLFVGKSFNGQKRWLGWKSFTFQPSEFAKLALIIFLAYTITNMGKEINSIKGFLKIGLDTGVLIFCIALSNLSAGIIMCGIIYGMTFIATSLYVLHAGVLVVFIALLNITPVIITKLSNASIINNYRFQRILVWVNPQKYSLEGGFQILQGLYAIGSGGLMGKGLGESIQKLGYIPEAQNDMIFTIICEELGLFGGVCMVMVFLFLIYRLIVVASSAPDLYGSLLVIGVMVHIAIQLLLNIAVVTGVVPNTGITLPFISYGGTSVLFLMIEMGLVLSVSRSIRLEY